jgi:hypothetical protein
MPLPDPLPSPLTKEIARTRLVKQQGLDPITPYEQKYSHVTEVWIRNHLWEQTSTCSEEIIQKPECRLLAADRKAAYLWDKPLLFWYSYSYPHQPRKGGRMFAGNPTVRLASFDLRAQSLYLHLRGSLTQSPYLQVCTNPEYVAKDITRYLTSGICSPRVVLIDPRPRLRAGLPIIHYDSELGRYSTRMPADVSQLRERAGISPDHYLCLWEITKEEIVHEWEWTDLSQSWHWYENTVEPALRKHQEQS